MIYILFLITISLTIQILSLVTLSYFICTLVLSAITHTIANILTTLPFVCFHPFFPLPPQKNNMHSITVTTEALSDVPQGFMEQARFSAQTVEFLCLLTKPCFQVKWLKEGHELSDSDRIVSDIQNDGMLHSLTVSNVDQSDQGIYTVRISLRSLLTHVHFEGNSTDDNIRKNLLDRAREKQMTLTYDNQS